MDGEFVGERFAVRMSGEEFHGYSVVIGFFMPITSFY